MVVEIEFCNKTKNPVVVLENDRTLLVLPPKGTVFCEIFDWKTSYAKWKRVIFDNGRVKFEENPDYIWPYPGQLQLELLNTDGSAIESFTIGNQFYHCFRNIPKFIPVSINDLTWCFIAKAELMWVESKKLEGDFYVKHRELKLVKTVRSKKECKAIEKQLEEAAVLKARQEIQAKFLKPQEAEAPEMENR